MADPRRVTRDNGSLLLLVERITIFFDGSGCCGKTVTMPCSPHLEHVTTNVLDVKAIFTEGASAPLDYGSDQPAYSPLRSMLLFLARQEKMFATFTGFAPKLAAAQS